MNASPWATFAVNMLGAALLAGSSPGSASGCRPRPIAGPCLATRALRRADHLLDLQLELFEMLEGGYLPLALAYAAATK